MLAKGGRWRDAGKYDRQHPVPITGGLRELKRHPEGLLQSFGLDNRRQVSGYRPNGLFVGIWNISWTFYRWLWMTGQYPSPLSKAYLARKAVHDRFKQEITPLTAKTV